MLEGKSKFNVSNVCCNRIFTRPMLHTGSYVPTSRCIAENLGKRHKNSVCEQHNSQKSPKWKGTHLISIDLELYPIEASKQIQPLGYILMAASFCSVNGYRVRCLPDMAYYLTFFGSAHPLHYKRKFSQVKKKIDICICIEAHSLPHRLWLSVLHTKSGWWCAKSILGLVASNASTAEQNICSEPIPPNGDLCQLRHDPYTYFTDR